MDTLSFILVFLAILFLAPVAAALHTDLHTRLLTVISQINPTVAQPAFTIFQVVEACMFVIAVVGCILQLRNGKFLLATTFLLLGAAPIVLLHFFLISVA